MKKIIALMLLKFLKAELIIGKRGVKYLTVIGQKYIVLTETVRHDYLQELFFLTHKMF